MAGAVGETIILDNGSGMLKAGFGGDEAPRIEMPMLIGKGKYTKAMEVEERDFYIGEEAQSKRGILQLSYPIEYGIVKDWDSMEKIWHHALYNDLRILPEDHPVLLTEAPSNPKDGRERMTEMFFETFQVPAFYVSMQAVLALYSSGRTTGLVVDSGDGITHVLPVYESYGILHALKCIRVAGRTVTDHLLRLLPEKNYRFDTAAEREIIRDLKERLCYIAQDYDQEIRHSQQYSDVDETYEMPDGQILHVSSERFRAPEILFQPSLIGLDVAGFHEQIYESVKKCDIDIRNDLLHSIILSGGNSMFPGLAERLQREVKIMVPSSAKVNPANVKVIAPPERKYSVWIGGSILGSLSAFHQMWITRDEYEEMGPEIVHRKCF